VLCAVLPPFFSDVPDRFSTTTHLATGSMGPVDLALTRIYTINLRDISRDVLSPLSFAKMKSMSRNLATLSKGDHELSNCGNSSKQESKSLWPGKLAS
jgi:hypothetical protein